MQAVCYGAMPVCCRCFPANDGSVILHNLAAIDFWCSLMQVCNLHICCLHCQTASQACSLDFCCLHMHQAPNGCGFQ